LTNIILGLVGALIYCILGYAASGEKFDPKKFLSTFAIAILMTLGLDVSGVTVDVYTAMVGPIAITVWLRKLIQSIAG